MISFVRIDNRLIHGQVVEAWLPHLKVDRVVVADDEAAGSPLVRAAMGLAVSAALEVKIEAVAQVPYADLQQDPVSTLLLLRNLPAVSAARAQGLALTQLNLGNVHFGEGRRQVSASVFLAPEEAPLLEALHAEGVSIDAQGVPTDKKVTYDEIMVRLSKSA